MRNVKQIFIGGILIGIVNLDNILQEIYELGIKDENKLKKRIFGESENLQLCSF